MGTDRGGTTLSQLDPSLSGEQMEPTNGLSGEALPRCPTLSQLGMVLLQWESEAMLTCLWAWRCF
eukprot:CAMPEP_0175855072 /NCGR_PEP_ID=MMETSP0107_2-20121207/27721_1 /TAXON_ID=195067 ORGANISM="Goniomonas pacifica, Strain CCMP1869" /NCGR_SAMPLE_ID=MMETSP0107_2 /ASSEMBLY_ACC=CAM_ASM_000203 /LENGTH=64 /DNA_ID=CAMNT_0017170989 /DNA_START=458 /DNA_END=652 /DNA_ORIENTATION=-